MNKWLFPALTDHWPNGISYVCVYLPKWDISEENFLTMSHQEQWSVLELGKAIGMVTN